MAVKTIAELVAEFDKVVTVAFGKKTLEYNPMLANLVASYKVAYAPTSDAIFKDFIGGLNQVTDGEVIVASTVPDTYKISITNNKFGQKVEVTESAFERASTLADLALYTSEVEALAVNAKDDPIMRGLAMLAAGHTNTYGTAFDGKNFFATDHLYGSATGQGNLLSGHGPTLAQVSQDMDAAYARMQGFYANAGGGKKLLNKNAMKLFVVCPTQLAAVFNDLKTKAIINATDNSWKGNFDYVVNPFTDSASWYLINLENDGYLLNRPILNPIEKMAQLKNNLNQESATLNGLYKWQVDLRQGLGYGAWYKAIKVDNSGVSLFTVQTTSGANGSLSPDIVQVVSGSDVEITLTAASGYVIDKLFANSVDVTDDIADGVYTIENIAANTVIAATWKASE